MVIFKLINCQSVGGALEGVMGERRAEHNSYSLTLYIYILYRYIKCSKFPYTFFKKNVCLFFFQFSTFKKLSKK